MPPTSAAMELKVLINILTQGQAIPNLLNQVNQLSAGLTKLQGQAGQAGSGAGQGIAGIGNAGTQATNQMLGLEEAINKTTRALKFLAGGFLALESVRFIKGIADAAARAEVLQTTLHVVAGNAGIFASEIDKIDKSVQRMGITATSSRQSLVQMLQADLDVTWAPKLARAAQDLAVVSGMNSSATFQKLLTNIQQMDALGLRWMGVMVSREQAEKRFADQQGVTVKSLTRRQQVEAFMIETHRQLLTLEGAYVASMDNVGKQLLSLERLTDTLKQTLGDGLLPVYSALVSELGHFYEQLIVVARVATANVDSSKEMAESVRAWAITIRESLVEAAKWILDHIELIKNLIRWGVELKLTIMAFRLVTWIGGGAIAFVEFLLKARLALQAFTAGQVGLLVALELLRARSLSAAAAQLQLSIAQQTAAVSAGTATVATSGLSKTLQTLITTVGLARLAWIGLAAVVAVPIIGYAIYRQRQEEADKSLSFAERFKKTQEMSKTENLVGAVMGGDARDLQQGIFEEWLKTKQEVVKKLEADKKTSPGLLGYKLESKGPLQDLFKAEMAATTAQTEQAKELNDIYGQILQKRQDIAKFQDQQLAAGATDPEIAYATAQMNSAQAELAKLQATLKAKFGLDEQAVAERELMKAQQRRWNAERGQAELTGQASKAQRDAVEATLKKAKEEETEADKRLDLVISSTAGMSADNAKRVRQEADARIAFKKAQEFETERTAALTTLFKGRLSFTGGRVEPAAFGQEVKAFDTLLQGLDKAKETRAKAKPEDQIAAKEMEQEATAQTREGLKALSQGITNATMAEFQTNVKKYVAATGDVQTANLAMARARQAARQESLAFTSPILSEKLDDIRRVEGAQVEADKLAETKLKNKGVIEGDILESAYQQNLVLLDDYFNQRVARIEREGEAEKKVQNDQIKEQLLLQEKALQYGDKKQADAFGQQAQVARDQIPAITGRIEAEVAKLRGQQGVRRTELTRSLRTAQLEQAAQDGSVAAQLARVNDQLEQEKKKYFELGQFISADYFLMKQLNAEADIYKKEREDAWQRELALTKALQDELALRKGERDVAAAKDKVAVGQGDMTTLEAQRRNNSRIVNAQLDNRVEKSQKEADLVNLQIKQANDLFALRGRLGEQLIRQQITKEELDRRMTSLQQEQTAEIAAQRTAILGLDSAYEELAMGVENYSRQIHDAFVSGLADTFTEMTLHFSEAGKVWASMADNIKRTIVGIFAKAFAEALDQRLGLSRNIGAIVNRMLGVGRGGGGTTPGIMSAFAEGGVVNGPGTGTSDSIPALVSAGEHIMPASKTAQWLPLLEGIRMGRIVPSYALGGVVALQSLAMPSIIPRRYASGGMVVSDAGSATVQPGGGIGHMTVSLHPDAMNMTLREWLEQEVVRQQGRR